MGTIIKTAMTTMMVTIIKTVMTTMMVTITTRTILMMNQFITVAGARARAKVVVKRVRSTPQEAIQCLTPINNDLHLSKRRKISKNNDTGKIKRCFEYFLREKFRWNVFL